MNAREVLEFAKKNKVQVVDLKFVDLIGTWQHFTIPTNELTEDLFKDGSGLDGSSIRLNCKELRPPGWLQSLSV